MIELSDDRLTLAFGAPLIAAALVFSLARAPWLWTRIAAALVGHGIGVVVAVGLGARVLSRGGFAFVDIDGWVGTRITGNDWFGWVPSTLTPGTVPLLVAVEIAGLLASILLVPAARTARSSAPLAAVLFATGFCAMLVIARRVDGICAAFALSGLAGFALLVSFHPQRTDVEGAMRAFLLQRAGDALLLCGVFIVGVAAGGIDLEKLATQAPAIDPWARAVAGPLTGFAAREVWGFIAALVAAAAATRLALLPLLPLVRDATGAPGPAVGFAHGAAFVGSGLVLLIRMTPILWLAPEVMTALGWLAAASALFAALFALASRDLVRIDVHLLCGFAAVGTVALAGSDLGTGVLAAMLVIAAAVPLCATSAVVVETTGRADPHALGALEKLLPRTHTAKLLVTGALFGPIFTGAFVAAHTAASSLFAPWLGMGPCIVVAVSLPLLAVAAFRPLHLVFTGVVTREPLSRTVVEPKLSRTLPPLVVALPLVGVGLLHLPEGVLAALPMSVTYRSPMQSLLLPERSALHLLRVHVLPALVSPQVHPTVVAGVILGGLALGWIASLALYRGGPRAAHKKIFGGARMQKVVNALSTVAGRESQVAKGVGEQAARLSRLIATNLAPGVLDTLLRRIPSLIAMLAGLVVRFLANGSSQRGLVVALVVLAILAVVLR